MGAACRLRHHKKAPGKLARRMIGQTGCGATDPSDRGTRIEPKQDKHEKVLGLHTADQFWAAQLNTVKEREFCIPSQKID